ncbi:diacylglycerol kinase family lipid kinase [Solibacillus sp. MA9]|uniref:Diacylglycerol kinase family lipid kinase n=1 Tax=Solibacillus palustris TaxID=2908203 RepID=A0ABS9UE84_9BACL|nr:diacylglycerol kinase family protein [Solibacillus sp. MA9]MCH7322449.1 diacylglycerol kinase family lipid kinase [Solibacillus sp. MA9]
MRVHFILNPNAGNGRAKKRWLQFNQQLSFPYELHETQYVGHTFILAQDIAKLATKELPVCIVAIGGDGTVHEVLNGAANVENVYIGAIAAGSGNDFARGYTVFANVQQLEQFVATIETTVHDYGIAQINGAPKLFVNNFGVGFDALVANTANESQLKKKLNKWSIGKLSYPYFVIYALFTFKPFQLNVKQNGNQQQFQNVWFATVSNQPYFGGGMNISPKSNTSDGKLEVTVVSNLSKWKLLFLFGSVFFAKHTRLKEVYQFETTALELEFSDSVMAHADGENQLLLESNNKIAITVIEKAWQLAK